MTTIPTGQAQASRYGQPWTDEDYEGLISAVRSGLDEQQIAKALGRPSSTVLGRIRKLLPVEVRQCPYDRVLPAARDAFEAEGYDWRVTILHSPPPRPIVTPAPIVRHGVAGLSADELGTIAFSLASTGGTRCAELLERVCAEMHSESDSQNIARDLAAQWLRRSGAPIGWGEYATQAAHDWLSSADGWSLSAPHSRRYGWEPGPEWDTPYSGWRNEDELMWGTGT